MSSHSIGGVLDYARLAQLHRPTDRATVRREVQRLARSGLTAMDISTALRLDLTQVREMLEGEGHEQQR